MSRVALSFAAIVVGCLFAPPAHAQPYDLNEVKHIDRFVGSSAARDLLARQGFVVTHQQFAQLFAAYTDYATADGLPNFITEDSVWHAYHVLLEDGLRELEREQARVLLQFSTALLTAAKAKSVAKGDVYWDLATFAAVGLLMQQSSESLKVPKDIRVAAEKALRKIESNEVAPRVLFFRNSISPALREINAYSDDNEMRDYAQARVWYATSHFALRSTSESERAVGLALLIEGDPQLKDMYRQLTIPFDELVGPPDDATVSDYVQVLAKPSQMPAPRVNDQDQSHSSSFDTRGFRLLPARRCPSAVILQRTTHPLVPNRRLPSGLDFFAIGPSDCEPAQDALRKLIPNPEQVDAILSTPEEPLPSSIHGETLALIKQLQKPLAAEAPAPLRTAAWRDKQLWTAMGMWAQQRHSYAAHIKLSVIVEGIGDHLPGYVSPNPEFFRGLSKLARRTQRLLATYQAAPAAPKVGQEVLNAANELTDPRNENEQVRQRFTMPRRLRELYQRCCEMNQLDTRPSCKPTLIALAQRWIAADDLTPVDIHLIELWANEFHRSPVQSLGPFADMCDRLAGIAEAELKGQAIQEEDAKFIREFGLHLAAYQDYDLDSWVFPRDDFPQAVPIFVDPSEGRTLYASVARPEAIYVVLKVGEELVLHRGAVLSYREFVQPTGSPLDDEGWRALINAGNTPPPPAFTATFRNTHRQDELRESQQIVELAAHNPWKQSRPPSRANSVTTYLGWAVVTAIVCTLGVVALFVRGNRKSKS